MDVGGNFVGTFASTGALEAAYPAAANTGKTALVGTTSYTSNGTAWAPTATGSGSSTVPVAVYGARAAATAQASAAKQAIDYADSAQFIEQWADLTQWGATQVAVSANKLYCSTTGTSGAQHSWSIGAGEASRLRTTVVVPAAGAGAALIFVGFGVGTAGAVLANSNGVFGIGITETNQPFFWQRGVNAGAGAQINLGGGLAAGTYTIDLYVDALSMSFVLKSTDGATERRISKLRSLVTGGANAITNLSVWNSDTRLGSGIAIGPIAIRKSNATVNPRTGFDGTSPFAVATTDVNSQGMHIATPVNYDSRKPAPLILFCHGNLGDQYTPVDDPLNATTYQALLNAGYIVASHQQHGNNWGNQSAVDDLVILYQYCMANFAVSHVGVIAQSMGGLSSLTAIGQKKIPVEAWLGIYPVCNLANLYALGTYTSAINTAYGISGDYAAKTAGYDPVLSNASVYTGIDMTFYASTGDTVVPKVNNSDVMATLVASTARTATEPGGNTGNHGDPSHFQTANFLAFFAASFAG